MKNIYNRILQNKFLKSTFGLILLLTLNFNLNAQNLPECDTIVPYFIVNLSSAPDSMYTTPEIIRNGQCCGGAGNENYVSFYVTLNPNVAAVEIGILPGYADPGGSGFYGIITGGDTTSVEGVCGPETAGGDPTCIVGSGPHKLTYHKPGKNKVKYYLKQIPQPIFPQDDTTRVNCSLPLEIFGLDSITITSINSSTGDTTQGAFNGYLDCTDCDSPVFSPGLGAPAWIDYQICGTQQASTTCGVFATCDTVRLYILNKLELSVDPNPAEFCAGDSVLLTATASGGDSTFYSYVWLNSGNDTVSLTNTYYASIQGSYTVKVKDGLSFCPVESEPVDVMIALLPEADAGSDQTVCASNPITLLSGSVLNATGGAWSNGTGTYDPSADSLVIYYTPSDAEIIAGFVDMILTTTDSGGCDPDSDTMTIFISDTVYVNPTYPPVVCTGDTTTISAGASGGTPGYTYNWSTTYSSNPTISVSAGTYSLTVYDIYGCSADTVINVTEPSPIFLDLSSTNTSTDSTCDGTATVIITGGDSPYSILWSTTDTTLSISNLCYGIVTIDVIDSNGCLASGSVVVNNPTCSGFNVSTSKTDVSCYGDTTGTATALAVGGVPPYSYSWNTSPVQTTDTAINLGAGTYTVTATDSLLCIDVASATILQPTVLTNTMTHTDVTSMGGSDGTATANPAGGVPGYTYVWSPTPQFTQTAANLDTGMYYVQITDSNSCVKTDSVFINQPPCNDFMIAANPTPVTCHGYNDGSAYVIIANGTPPFLVSWSTGDTTMSVSNLAPGAYSVSVTDSSNCTTFMNFDITEPDTITLGLAPTNITCYGAGDGTIDLTVSGGTFPYSYDWTKGGFTIATYQDLDLLTQGTYSIEVTDDNGCIAQGSAGISEPTQLMASYNYQDITCHGDGNGSIDVTVSGGTLPYSYAWTGPNSYNNNTQDIFNLAAGLYQLQVTDGNGCMLGAVIQAFINEPDSVIIESYTVPCPAPGADSVTVTIDSISGGAGGNYQVSFNGGSTYQDPGDYSATLPLDSTYYVVAIDSNGCNSPDTLILTIDPKVEITAVDFNPCIAPGTTDINITVTPQGGDGGPYEVSTDGGSSYTIAAGTYVILLPVDSAYNIVIRDGKGCESLPWPIVLPAPFTDTIVLLSEVSCNGASDGSLDLTITGGTPPYSIAWTGPSGYNSTNEDISGLFAGWYYVTITDDSNCVIMDSIDVTTVPDVTPPVITFCPGNQNENSDSSFCSYTHAGTAWDATATDNCVVASLEYSLSGATSGTGTSLNGVVFNVGVTTVLWTATDGLGNIDTCSFTVTVEDNQPPSITSCGAVGTQNVNTDFGVCSYTHSGTAWDATATDNCTVSTISYLLSGATAGSGTSLNGVSFNLGTTTVTWTVTDSTGNTAFCMFDVIVTDDQLPIITSCGAAGTQNVNTDPGVCTYTHSGTAWNASATDNCTISTIAYTLTGATTGSGTSLNGVVFELGTTTVTWTVTDSSGNFSTCMFDVIVSDNQLPSIISCGPGGNQNVDSNPGVCTYTHTGTAWNAIATDNCSVSTIIYTLTGATIGSGTSLNGVVFNLGTTTVTWTVTDGSGNISTCNFDVIVADNQLPAIISCGPGGTQNVNADFGVCTYTQSGTGWDATATDNCSVSTIIFTLSGATSGSGTSLNGVSFNLGTTTVTWTVTDGSGNTSFCMFDVIVTDDQLPAITSCGAGGTQNVDTDPGVCSYTQTGTAWDATVTDNCSVSSLTYSLSGATTGSGTSLNGVVFNLGTTTVTWTVIDGSGNVSTCNFDVVVADNQLPVVTSCGAAGNQNVAADPGVCNYTHSGTAWDASATDNCTVSTIGYTLSGATSGSGTSLNGVVFNLGTTTVLWTVTDGSGNTSTCTFDVIVSDDQLPQLSCPADISSCDSLVTFNTPSASDNCGVVSVVQIAGLPSGSFFPVGTTVVTFEALDVNGNTNTCSFNVIIHPTPTLSTVDTDVSCYLAGDGGINLTVNGGTAPFTYLWSNSAVTEDISNLEPGIYAVVVSDVFGCSASTSDTITQPLQLNVTGTTSTATCGAANGSIQVTVTGGTTPYEYIWSNGTTNMNLDSVVAGPYTLIVTDDNGCTFAYSDTVEAAANLSAHLHLEDVKCYAESNGSAIVDVDSGNPPYTYDWSNANGANNTPFNDSLIANDYWVTVTDRYECEITLNFTINQPDSLYIVLETYTSFTGFNISEHGGSDGWITAMVYGGTQPFDYLWSTGETTSELFNLPAGSYQLTVIDENGCSATEMIRLVEPDLLQMPEGLSPNSDGDNDYFVILGLQAYPNNTLTIYNRWGNIVFTEDGYDNDWQGDNKNGEELPDGTYFAILNIDGLDPLTGYVDLRRSR